MRTVRIGAAQGFYGDTIEPAVDIAKNGNVDYISFDCLAELTMSILVKDKMKDPTKGYTKDITTSMKALLPYVKEKGIKLLTNAGGVNPEGAYKEVVRVAKELGISGLKVAMVTGDDILERIPELQEKGVTFDHMETGESIENVKDKLLFANVYLGVKPIVEALQQGADIVVTGRTTDTAQFLAPLVYEFGWNEDDWDRLAQGILMGHLLECSAQSTGGNFSGNWWDVDEMDRIGYPIAEVKENGEFILTKTETSGGLVNFDTIREQMLYEIHDPAAYITPEVVANFTTARLEEIGKNRVLITGTTGKPRPQELKAVMGYPDGYRGQVIIGYSWPDALKKVKKAEEIIRKQMQQRGLEIEEIMVDYIGHNSLHGPNAEPPKEEDDLNEVFMRMAVRTKSFRDAERFRRLVVPLGLNGPPSMGGGLNGARPRALLGMWASLIPRELIESKLNVQTKEV